MKKLFMERRILKLVLVLLFLVSLALYFILTAYGEGCINKQSDITAYREWAGDQKYGQISCYFDKNAYISEYTVQETKFNINNELRQLGKQEETESDHFLYAYYGENEGRIASEERSVSVKMRLVGGDYFLLHPLKMLTGTYFTPADVMQDYCIVDEKVAFELFGSDNIAGQLVVLDGCEFIVRGVFESNTERFHEAAGDSGKIVYVSQDGYAQSLGYGLNDARPVDAYEFVLPNDVPGYALDIVKKCFSDSSTALLIDQSERFDMENLWEIFKHRSERSMIVTRYYYPFWENIARAYEDILARVFVGRALCLLICGVLFVTLLVYLYRNLRPSGADIKNFFEKIVEGVRKLFRRKRFRESEVQNEENL